MDKETTQGYKAVSDPALSSARRFADCEWLEIDKHRTPSPAKLLIALR